VWPARHALVTPATVARQQARSSMSPRAWRLTALGISISPTPATFVYGRSLLLESSPRSPGTVTLAILGTACPPSVLRLVAQRAWQWTLPGTSTSAEGGINRIRKVNPQGIITTVAGDGFAGYSGDGGPATSAQLNWPLGATLDASGNFYVADYGNHAIRKVSATGIITTVAGNGSRGFSGGWPGYGCAAF